MEWNSKFGAVFNLMEQYILYFPRKDHRPGFHVVNCWYVSFCEELHLQAISRKRDTIYQDESVSPSLTKKK